MTGGRPRSQGGAVGVTRAAYGAVRAVYIGFGAMPDHVRELLVGEIRRRASGGAISLNHLGAVSFRQYGTPQIPRSERALTRCTLMPAPNAVLTAPLECIETPVFSSFNHTRARVRIDTKFDLILQTGHQDCTHTRRGNQLRQRGILRQTPRTVPRCQRHYLCYLK